MNFYPALSVEKCVKLPLFLVFLFVLPSVFGRGEDITIRPLGLNYTTSSSCKEMLDSFAYMTSNFTYCAILHARPINLCQQCVTSYLEVKKVYADILQIEDMGGGVCKDQLINLDRLQVVSSGIGYVDQLWERAFCNSCFTFDHGKPALTEKVAHLLNASAVLDACIATYHNSTDVPDNITCIKCVENYLYLNDLYNNMKADTGEINFCMDIVDMMNTTRYQWSKVLGCCNDRKKPEKTFIAIMSGILIASFLFYIGVFAFTRRAEQPIVPQKRWKEEFTKRPSLSTAISS